MSGDWTIELSIREKRGLRSYHMASDLDLETFGERLADNMRAGLAFAGPGAFDQTVAVLKQREFRRDLLVHAAKMLAEQLENYLEDREGWHGVGRQETILRNERTK